MSVEEARALMHEWVQSPALRIHMECVAVCMASQARSYEPDRVDRWIVTGLLHDFDYERHPTSQEHPFIGVKHLESLGVDRAILDAILGHAQYSGVARETAMAKSLFAVDELAGFIVACAKVRPNGIADLEARSVKKKLKDKAFAAKVSREDIAQGIEELGVDRDAHLAQCISALQVDAERLGL